MKHWIFAGLAVAGCGTTEAEEPVGATVVGRIQGTEFLEPHDVASVWLESDARGLGALRLSAGTRGCGAPEGWSLLVQVNLMIEGHYQLGEQDNEPGKGFLVEYRRDDGSLDMPPSATGTLEVIAEDDEVIAGSMVLKTSENATLTAVFEAPRCPATALVSP